MRRARVDPHRPRQRNPRGQGSRLREEIIAATVRLIAERGSIEAVSLRGVAREAGIDPMSVYRHFTDKGDLVWAVLDAQFAHLARALDAAAERSTDPAGRLRERCLAYLSFAQDHSGEFQVLFGTAGRPHPPGGDPEQLPGWPVFAALRDDVAACLSQADGSTSRATTQATLLWAALHGLTVLRASKKAFPWPPMEDLIDQLLQQLVGRP